MPELVIVLSWGELAEFSGPTKKNATWCLHSQQARDGRYEQQLAISANLACRGTNPKVGGDNAYGSGSSDAA
ncbi:MAG: hypothetical protein VXZ84_06915 [Planctomycetota bacterium]|nr:hypothetical protein [Planctomycetota bacterium]